MSSDFGFARSVGAGVLVALLPLPVLAAVGTAEASSPLVIPVDSGHQSLQLVRGLWEKKSTAARRPADRKWWRQVLLEPLQPLEQSQGLVEPLYLESSDCKAHYQEQTVQVALEALKDHRYQQVATLVQDRVQHRVALAGELEDSQSCLRHSEGNAASCLHHFEESVDLLAGLGLHCNQDLSAQVR